ncbi:MAG TPA: Ig-like domain repeat protein [Casimicrobiaceae bacterium]|nr:Ig-like domain repeat protein [Casimicrobiaceae bacterium]
MPEFLSRLSALLAIALVLSLPAAAHHVDSVPQAQRTAQPASAAITVQGHVDQVLIENRVAGTTTVHPVLVDGNGRRYALNGRGAAAMASVLTAGNQVAVSGKVENNALFPDSALSVPNSVTARTMSNATATRTTEGVLRLGHSDNFDGGPSAFFYAVVSDDGQQQLMLDVAAELDGLASGMRVSVTGRPRDDGTFAMQTMVILKESTQPPTMALAAGVPATYLVIPIKFPTNAAAPWTYGADPFTPAALNTAVFGATSSSKSYYNEVSYGQQVLSGVTADNGSGGFLLANVAKPATCDIGAIATAAENAAKARSYNLANYTGILYVFNNVAGCGWSGLAYVGYQRAYSNNTTNLLVISHELGHNFGLAHAASLDCGTNVVGGACTSSEYGDPFDVMGNNRAMHFNSAQKSKLGYIAPGTVYTHGSGTSTYTISPIETGGAAHYAIKLPASANRTYWLEYRQPSAGVVDAGLSAFPNNGAQVRVASPFETLCSGCYDDTEFLDMTPGTAAFTDGTLVVGQTYTDAVYGITVTPTASTTSSLTLTVTAPGTTATTISATNAPATTNYGGAVGFTATVTGSGLTGKVNITEGGAAIAGCSGLSVSGGTATCSSTALSGGSHTLYAVYSGDATNATSTSAAMTQTVNKIASVTALTSSANPSAAAINVTFTATVTGGVGIPAGTVAFTDGAASMTGCTSVALNASGVATCTTSALTAASHAIKATYSGNVNYNGSSATITQVVTNAATTTAITSHSPSPSLLGGAVLVTASVTVTPPGTGTPTGTVTISDGTANCTITLPATSCNLTPLSTGGKTLTASYGGSASFAASVSPGVAHTVNQTPSITSANNATFQAGVSGTFTVTATGAPLPVLSVTGTLPSGIVFTPATGVLSGMPAAGSSGAYPLTFTASNGTGSNATQAFTLNILAPATAPGAPAAPVATAGNLSATVTFSAPIDGGSPITGYTVASNPPGGVDINAGTTSIPHVMTGLNNGTAYTFTVSATNSIGTGAMSPPSNSVTPTAGLAPILTGAALRRVHGTAGTFDLALSRNATDPTTEPRAGPAHTLVLAFDKPLTAGTVAITEGTAVAGTPSVAGNVITVSLTNVSDAQYVSIAYSNVAAADGGTGGSGSVRIGFLMGDLNQDRGVKVSDLGLVNAAQLFTLNTANFLLDVNVDGKLTVADKGLVSNTLLNKLPAP